MGNMKFGIFQNADWGLGGLVGFVDSWDSWIRGIRGLVGFVDSWDGGMEENKKSGGGDVRAEALSWDGEWDKA